MPFERRFPRAGDDSVHRVLLLGGTAEARELSERIASAAGFALTLSLAGRTRSPRLPVGVMVRVGGFGGEDGLRSHLVEERIDFVVDATHPFAARITEAAANVARELGCGHVVLRRPAWSEGPGDDWHGIGRLSELAGLVPSGSRVFLATGRQGLADIAAALPECRLLCRVIEPPQEDFPGPNGEFLVGRPPFPLVDEVALFRRERVDWLVVKNAGGDAARSKIDAARNLGLPVAVLKRPPPPECRVVETVDDCMDWLRAAAAANLRTGRGRG